MCRKGKMNLMCSILVALLLFSTCDKAKHNKKDIFNDYEKKMQGPISNDNNTNPLYNIKIGNQLWMANNLSTDTFNNGDKIFEAKSKEDWETAGINGTPAWCNFDNDELNSYGKLYNFFVIEDQRGVCPEGWRVATDEDWTRLKIQVGEYPAFKLKSKTGWYDGGNGSDEFGFNAKPNGIRYYNGNFYYLNENAFWWTGSSVIVKHAWAKYLDYEYSDRIFSVTARKGAGMGIRCIKNYGDLDKQ